jgi:hypothetical protein
MDTCEYENCKGGRLYKIREKMFCSPTCGNFHFRIPPTDSDFVVDSEKFKTLWDKVSVKGGRHGFTIDIIDNVNVNMFIINTFENTATFYIQNLYDSDDVLYCKKISSVNKLESLFLRELPTLKFDKYFGKFLKYGHCRSSDYDGLIFIHKLQRSGGKCIHCLKYTSKFITECRHNLCLPCITVCNYECPTCNYVFTVNPQIE